MPQTKILVDTNTYLRLANTIRPLLFEVFGDDEYCLYVLPELNEELESRKLQTKFHWVTEEEFAENRLHFLNVGRKKNKAIQQTFEYLWDYVQTEHPGPSRVDARYIAYAIEFEIPVVTDDQDMTALAEAFGAQTMPTLELLRIMLDCEHISMNTLNGLVQYWRYISDLPANFNRDYERLFPEE